MKVIYHQKFNDVYSQEPAAKPGRMESIYEELKNDFDFVEPYSADDVQLRLVHTDDHIESVKSNKRVYEVALLAVGGAVKASELAMEDEPSFALIRPPGHHAGKSSSWGFCYFNNVAVSIEHLRRAGKVQRALIVDIDLHYGDGTADIFSGVPEVFYIHIQGRWREEYFKLLRQRLDAITKCDVVAVSAGFDTHEEDWGRILSTDDYRSVAKTIKEYAEKLAGGRRYSVLEGGYNISVLGKNVRAFLEGFK